jgi:hypothetical protein
MFTLLETFVYLMHFEQVVALFGQILITLKEIMFFCKLNANREVTR